ncbi:MAG: SDR family NAD(P)-dependent oxidoreductase [Ignavibacteriales bacterium]|nr:SDR family NAD(P)-dependent oxidoreductase [Ignavibacteriales bacterium]
MIKSIQYHKTQSRVALITGGAKNLGKEIALSLANENFNLVINYNKSQKDAISLVKALREKGKDAIAIKADITKRIEVINLIKRSYKEMGRIDLLVNNAAVFRMNNILDTTEKHWDETINTNLKGAFLCSQAVAPIMLKQNSGMIINISSVAGIIGWKNYLPYSISKAAIIMLTRVLAKSLAPHILVNAIAPGYIEIPKKMISNRNKMPIKKILLNKYGNSKDITDAVLYLVTKGDYITGQILTIDGGRSIFS